MRLAGSIAAAVSAFAMFAAVSCSSDHGGTGSVDLGADASAPAVAPSHAGPHAESSLAFRDLPESTGPLETVEHEPLRPDWHPYGGVEHDEKARRPDPVVQSRFPSPSAPMPTPTLNFAGQGKAVGGPCVGGTSCSTPPDTNGAVGRTHYVQSVNINGNAGIAMWNKSGALVAGPKHVNTLWTGYTGFNAGNSCATQNDGDPVVVYDQLADRWFITQFSLPNSGTTGGPSFQCVAVSKTGDPTGAYWLYDFKYAYAINDYGKFGIWPDAYYAAFHMFNPGYAGDDFCAYDRAKMLSGTPETAAFQQCFLQAYVTPAACPATEPFNVFGAQPVSLEGLIPPPSGTPGFFLQFDYSQCGPNYNQLDLWKLSIDWTNPGNSKLSVPTVLTETANFTPTCFNATGANCIPQPGTTTTVDGLDDRLMFRFSYRNFGTYESLLVNHSVIAGAGSGVRWYEIRNPSTTPTIFQQSTFAPADGNWRWMGSIAQDQSNDLALGYAISSSTGGPAPAVAKPSIAWTGRLSTDPVSTMSLTEAVIDNGGGVEGDAYVGPPDQHRGRWGDYSNMTVDPTDDCTFWYTQELYNANAIGGWDTFIASVKYPTCAANDFTIGVAPATQTLQQGASASYTVTTTSTKGTAETIALTVQNLPTGVTGAFTPATVTAGGTSTLKLTATAAAPVTTATFMVIGTAPSAVHAATAVVQVITPCGGTGQVCCTGNGCAGTDVCNAGVCCAPATACTGGQTCGTQSNLCGGTITCGTCVAPQTCGGGGNPLQCGCTAKTACTGGQLCGTQADGCGGTLTCGTCIAPQTCGGGGNPLTCGCTGITTCGAGQTCGTIADGCGGAVTCGTCLATQTCTNNTCVNNPSDGGTTDGGSQDSGVTDSGVTDSGTKADSGTPDSGIKADSGTPDSGTKADSGTTVDSGSSDDSGTVMDSGSGFDATSPMDSGHADGAIPGDGSSEGGSGDTGGGGGCGCKTVETRNEGMPPALIAFGALALLGGVRLRRRGSRK